ncbi:MAG: DUF2203 domain-containing protein [Acidobacteriota bacterium]
MSEHFFTVAEVNALLPQVKRAAEMVRRGSVRLRALSAGLYSGGRPQADTPVDGDYMAGLESLIRGIDIIGSLGGEMKDLSSGLVDFPSLLEGREVLLCWKVGEERVGYWHDLHAGYAGRSAITDDAAFGGVRARDVH